MSNTIIDSDVWVSDSEPRRAASTGGSATGFYCYVLWNAARTHTYAGFTVNPARRLRQHNGEISGGARATSKERGGWSFLFLIKCDTWTNKQALSFEWYLKSHKRGWNSTVANPIDRRFDLLMRALAHEKFKDLKFQICVHPEHGSLQNFEIINLDARHQI